MTVLPFTDLYTLDDVLTKLDATSTTDGSEIVASCPVCGVGRRLKITRANDYYATISEPECGCQLDAVADKLGLPPDYLPENGLRIEEALSLRKWEDEAPISWRVEKRIFGSDMERARTVLQHARLTRRDVVYTADGGWLVWEGTTWAQVSEDAVRALVAEVGDRVLAAAIEVSSEAAQEATRNELLAEQMRAEAERLFKAARSLHTAKVIDGIIRSLRSLPGVGIASARGETAPSLADFDLDPDVLGFENGVVDLRTGELRKYTREDKITRKVRFKYDPTAQAPRWEKFLSEIFVNEDDKTDPEIVAYMHRLIGYGITGRTSEEMFAVLFGEGSNGKSKFLEALAHVFKDHTVTTPFETFEAKRAGGGIPNDLAALKGARLVQASEGNANAPMAEAVIKRLTGQDSVTARFMRAEFFTFAPTFLVLLATNAKPRFRGQEEGLWRRIRLIPFRRYFSPEERDYDLSEKLKAEAEGIAAWAVRGAVSWYAQGLGSASAIDKETKAYRSESDRLGDFIADRLDITHSRDDKISNKDLYGAYREWAHELGEEQILSSDLLRRELVNGRGLTPYVGNSVRGLRGARLWTDAERAQRERSDRTSDIPDPTTVF